MSVAAERPKAQPTSSFLHEMNPDNGFVPVDAIMDKGKELAAGYNAAAPFPHIVIDDFLPAELLEHCLDEFPKEISDGTRVFNRAQERLKLNFNPEELTPRMRTMFYAFNSWPFIRVLENITGIKGLIPDPYFLGAGFHEIQRGGHLSIHADFNHHKPMDLERRINVLIYLNKDWRTEYGGQLELWDRGMTAAVQTVDPIFNRCVIFNTDSDSYHGNPSPVDHPGGVSRKSIALYYYTSTWSRAKRDHTTQFKVRGGTQDRTDWKVGASELVADLTPPFLYRMLKKSRAQR
jgi:Rps23 Pro-64 3,4-dihydroxylase Tpa1-like proline 4-hydroxylase